MKDKEKTWKSISIFIRKRDAIKTTGTLETVKCYTCGSFLPVKEAHAGHFIDGRRNIFLTDERQIHAQCPKCNIELDGNKDIYMDRMIEDYGEEEVEKMILSRYKITKLDHDILQEYYRKKEKNLVVNFKRSQIRHEITRESLISHRHGILLEK